MDTPYLSECEIREFVEKSMPEWVETCKLCANSGTQTQATLAMHHDAFYFDNPTMRDLAIRYAGMHRIQVMICGKYGETIDDSEQLPGNHGDVDESENFVTATTSKVIMPMSSKIIKFPIYRKSQGTDYTKTYEN